MVSGGRDPSTAPMAFSNKLLKKQLLQVGNKLLNPPSSVYELLHLLDQVQSCLSRVDQSPTKSLRNALSPSLMALIDDKLFRHSDVDVKVAVASCISEITRITAPDAPYDDDKMKEVFQLIVSSFENLYDMSSRSYTKRTSILDTLAKIRSCVVMLDLECDALLLDMFQHFFMAIREHHPENVFSSMETIMTLVLEESDDISLDLLSPILVASVKNGTEGNFPIARKLGERVLERCATKLKPYLVLVQVVKALGIPADDFSMVLVSICQGTSGGLEQNDVCVTSEHEVSFPLDSWKDVTSDNEGTTSKANHKRKLPHRDIEAMQDKFTDLMQYVIQGNNECVSQIINAIKADKKCDRTSLRKELGKVPGLSIMQILQAMRKMTDNDVTMFYTLEDENEKYTFVQMVLGNLPGLCENRFPSRSSTLIPTLKHTNF